MIAKYYKREDSLKERSGGLTSPMYRQDKVFTERE